VSITTETRRAAHEDIKPEKHFRHQQIMEAITEHGPMTVDEVMEVLGYHDPNQVRPRLTELTQAGALCTIGKRRSRRSGKMVAVWAINEQKETAPGAANTEGGSQAKA
jgi:predicted ArsR family transcriptional regulator